MSVHVCFLRTDRCITILLLSWGIPARYKRCLWRNNSRHYCDVIMGPMASKITSLTIVYSTIYSGADQRKHQRSASLDFVRGIPRSPVTQRASNAENVSIWWRHNGTKAHSAEFTLYSALMAIHWCIRCNSISPNDNNDIYFHCVKKTVARYSAYIDPYNFSCQYYHHVLWSCLTHHGPVTQTCVSELGQHWFRW